MALTQEQKNKIERVIRDATIVRNSFLNSYDTFSWDDDALTLTGDFTFKRAAVIFERPDGLADLREYSKYIVKIDGDLKMYSFIGDEPLELELPNLHTVLGYIQIAGPSKYIVPKLVYLGCSLNLYSGASIYAPSLAKVGAGLVLYDISGEAPNLESLKEVAWVDASNCQGTFLSSLISIKEAIAVHGNGLVSFPSLELIRGSACTISDKITATFPSLRELLAATDITQNATAIMPALESVAAGITIMDRATLILPVKFENNTKIYAADPKSKILYLED